MEKELITVNDFALANGGLYSGQAFKDSDSSIEITGKGRAIYDDGSSYSGSWQAGMPMGLGTYCFADGTTHKGYFCDTADGVGVYKDGTNDVLIIGHYNCGELNGWALTFYGHYFEDCKFQYMRNGHPIGDYTADVIWMMPLLQSFVFNRFKGNNIQFSKEEFGYIRFGAPKRTSPSGKEKPAIGFVFSNDGTVFVGQSLDGNKKNGAISFCSMYGSVTHGLWKDDVLKRELTCADVAAHVKLTLIIEQQL